MHYSEIGDPDIVRSPVWHFSRNSACQLLHIGPCVFLFTAISLSFRESNAFHIDLYTFTVITDELN